MSNTPPKKEKKEINKTGHKKAYTDMAGKRGTLMKLGPRSLKLCPFFCMGGVISVKADVLLIPSSWKIQGLLSILLSYADD